MSCCVLAGSESDGSGCNVYRFIGGAEEDRTPDLCIANAALSQLSYGPVCGGKFNIGFGYLSTLSP